PAIAKMQRRWRRDCHLRRRFRVLADKFEMVEHGMSGERSELSDNAQHHGFRVDPVKLDLAFAEIGFNARELSEKIVVPERTAEFAVGDGTKTDLFLFPDRGRDYAILDRFQLGGRDITFLVPGARFLERPCTQKTADVISAKGRGCAWRHTAFRSRPKL